VKAEDVSDEQAQLDFASTGGALSGIGLNSSVGPLPLHVELAARGLSVKLFVEQCPELQRSANLNQRFGYSHPPPSST